MAGKIYIGTSGWSYKDWKGIFYDEKLKSSDYLAFYSKSFNTTEINTSFYHLPLVKTIEGWISKVPGGFKFCPKISRYITHIKRLREPEEPLERFFTIFEPMKKMMGPVLIQLPPSLKFDLNIAKYFFEVLKENYTGYNFALEARHASWFEKESIDLLSKYEIAFVISNSNNLFPYAEFTTAKNVYLRFHGPKELFASLYTKKAMNDYARKFIAWQKQGHDVWAFFNNDWHGYALENANYLKDRLNLKK